MNIKSLLKRNLTVIRAIYRYKQYVSKRFYQPLQNKKYGHKSDTSYVETPAFFTNQANVYLEDYTKIRHGLILINSFGKFIVKKFTSIATNCTVVTGNHGKITGVPHTIAGGYHICDNEKDVIIEEECWIGVNCTLLPGTKIGRGSVIGGCSMVNKEIPPYAVAVGSPAKVIASTFTIDQILEHEKTLYAPEERYTKEELNDIFNNYYIGKKAIGINPTDEMRVKVAKIASELGIKFYSDFSD